MYLRTFIMLPVNFSFIYHVYIDTILVTLCPSTCLCNTLLFLTVCVESSVVLFNIMPQFSSILVYCTDDGPIRLKQCYEHV